MHASVSAVVVVVLCKVFFFFKGICCCCCSVSVKDIYMFMCSGSGLVRLQKGKFCGGCCSGGWGDSPSIWQQPATQAQEQLWKWTKL